MPATIIVDAFWGDGGKGKFSAYLSLRLDAKICVRPGVGPNAGHSIFQGDTITKTRMLPLGFVNPKTKVMLGSGVAVAPKLFASEVEQTRTSKRAFVDGRCAVITPAHIAQERKDKILISIDSTMSGSGAARADYIWRRVARAENHPDLKPFCIDVAAACNQAAKKHTIIIEGAQATFLSLSLSNRYPFTTSDNCTTAAFLDDVGLNWRLLERVLMVVKCIPTSVGNGPLPNEMSNAEIKMRGLQEFGTNTGRPRRRVQFMDMALLKYAAMLNGPTEIALTYCDQYDREITGKTDRSQITKPIRRLISQVERACEAPVRYLDTGKQFSHIMELDA